MMTVAPHSTIFFGMKLTIVDLIEHSVFEDMLLCPTVMMSCSVISVGCLFILIMLHAVVCCQW